MKTLETAETQTPIPPHYGLSHVAAQLHATSQRLENGRHTLSNARRSLRTLLREYKQNRQNKA